MENTDLSFPEAWISQVTSWLSLKSLLFWDWKQDWCTFELCRMLCACVCCGNRCVKVLSPFTQRFHPKFSKLTSGRKELALTWPFIMGIRCRLASVETGGVKNLFFFWGKNRKKQTYSTLVLFHGVTLVLILQSFASDGINRDDIDSQIQQRCLPKISSRYNYVVTQICNCRSECISQTWAPLLPAGQTSARVWVAATLLQVPGRGSVGWSALSSPKLHIEDQSQPTGQLRCPSNTWLEEATPCSLCCITC